MHLMTYSKNTEGAFDEKYVEYKGKESKKPSAEHCKSDSREIMTGNDTDEIT